jgi:hypothetical protein
VRAVMMKKDEEGFSKVDDRCQMIAAISNMECLSFRNLTFGDQQLDRTHRHTKPLLSPAF